MQIVIASDPRAMGQWSANRAAELLKQAIARQGAANMIVATGASQFDVLAQLVTRQDVDWSKVTGFHLDEYVGLSADHPASFCGYLRERFVSRVPLANFFYLPGDQPPAETIERVGGELAQRSIDLALVGIGENGHLAFNDPPADFETESPYLIVELDEACRQQQVGEGWFGSLEEVPQRAISMSIRQILRTQAIICSVPDARKSQAVQATVEGPQSPAVPASILQSHPHTQLVLDRAAASRLSPETLAAAEQVS
jgi:glucosamine-6-phosphate deaminase